MDNELKEPFDTLKRNEYSYSEDLKFGLGSIVLIGGTGLIACAVIYFVAKSVLALLS